VPGSRPKVWPADTRAIPPAWPGPSVGARAQPVFASQEASRRSRGSSSALPVALHATPFFSVGVQSCYIHSLAAVPPEPNGAKAASDRLRGGYAALPYPWGRGVCWGASSSAPPIIPHVHLTSFISQAGSTALSFNIAATTWLDT
jgi:hypothetical protein